MSTSGVDAFYITTHNWGATAKFLTGLGFTIDFETDHNSGQLTAPEGPSIFVAEVPASEPTEISPVVRIDDEAGFDAPFADTHYGAREATLRDPDGRTWVVQAPGPR
ncbi:VOC family protein [Tsukamurella sputi]|uniref:VOC family protein n=1 Tax=Tsukamurella sputi TaxID=2591848 RepID=A0A5C5RU81_9ACTN|nr:VOC family protein [Tsukamurella sputi]TWS25715.1 VOC family protein [Tsukamurella sputi]